MGKLLVGSWKHTVSADREEDEDDARALIVFESHTLRIQVGSTDILFELFTIGTAPPTNLKEHRVS